MSDPREFERDPSLSSTRYVGRQSSAGDNTSGWIIGAIVAVILIGLAAYSYRDTQVISADNPPATTSGQGMRAPVPSTPPSTPVAPSTPAQ